MKSSVPACDAFLSYSHADGEWVHGWLLPRLEEAGVRVRVDVSAFHPGRPILENIERAVAGCRHTLAVLTPAWIESEWAEMEAILAQTGDPAARRRRLIPLLLAPCSVPARIAMLSGADFTRQEGWDDSLRLLLASLRGDGTADTPAPLVRLPREAPFLVPFGRTARIVGREAELARLRDVLAPATDGASSRAAALAGMGGAGKTQLAVAYTFSFRASHPDGVFWLNASRPLLHEFAALAEALEVAARDAPVDKAARAAWAYLHERPQALVVYDDVTDALRLNEPFAYGMVPLGLPCAVLLTTRDRRAPAGVAEIPVGPVAEDAALRILLRARPEILSAAHPEYDAARAVCRVLGRLPLALELTAAYLARYADVAPSGYLARLRAKGALATTDEVAESDVAPAQLATRYQAGLTAALRTQWERLRETGARFLLVACALFEPGAFVPAARLGLMAGLEGDAGALGRVSPLQRAVTHLHELSLVDELSAGRLLLHPLVHEFAAGVAPTGILGEMSLRLAEALEDAGRLEGQVSRRGIDEVVDDLRSVLRLPGGDADETGERLRVLERVLDRNAHELRGSRADEEPVRFLQQVLVRAEIGRAAPLARSAARQLASGEGGYLRLVWHAGGESPELVRVMAGRRRIYCLAALPDGRRVVSGHSGGRIAVWDAGTGRLERTLKLPPSRRHWNLVKALVALADGRRIAAGMEDGTIAILDLETGNVLREFRNDDEEIRGLAALPDGQRIVSGAYRTLTLWDADTGRELDSNEVPYGMNALTLLPDGHTVVEGDREAVLCLWDTDSGRRTCIPVGGGEIYAVAGLPDGRIAAAAGIGPLAIVDPATEDVEEHEGHGAVIYGVSVLDDGRVVTGSWDRTLRVWDPLTWTVTRVLTGQMYGVSSLAVLPDGRRLVSAEDTRIRLWDLGAPVALRESDGAGEVIALAMLDDGRVLARMKPRPSLHVEPGLHDRLRAWELDSGRESPVFPDDEARIGGLSEILRGAYLNLPRNNWQLPIGCEDPDGVRVTLALPDGRRIDVAWEEGALRVRDVATRADVCMLKGHEDTVWSVAVLPDGRLISASSDTTIRVWDLQTPSVAMVLRGHGAQVPSVAVIADGRIASVSLDQTLRIWSVGTAREIAAYRGESPFLCVASSPDGRSVLAGDATGAVYHLAFEEPQSGISAREVR
ncbi:MAG TPA: TIR domain-containing protein [Longimicrobium sp.]|nr:TIR domain-containing protein [Longimicrobium sp.]